MLALKRNIFIGLSDGLIIPFALATGLYAADVRYEIILLAVGIHILASAVIIGISSYVTTKDAFEDAEKNKKSDTSVLETSTPDSPISKLGLDKKTEKELSEDIQSENHEWANHITAEKEDTPIKSAMIIGVSFLIAGMVTLLPYYFFKDDRAFYSSFIFTLIVLGYVGFKKTKLMGGNGFAGALRLIIICFLIATAAYVVGNIFSRI